MRDPEICLCILKLAIQDEEFSEIRIMKSPNPLIDEQTDVEAALTSTNAEKGCARQEARGAGFPSVARASHAAPAAERDSHVDASGLYAETQKTLKFTKEDIPAVAAAIVGVAPIPIPGLSFVVYGVGHAIQYGIKNADKITSLFR